jgi:hypothetical protein
VATQRSQGEHAKHHQFIHQRATSFYFASLLVLSARSILALTHRLFLMKILDVAGVKYGVRTSEAIRSLGWRYLRAGNRSSPTLAKSALGHWRTFAPQNVMSALPPIADTAPVPR